MGAFLNLITMVKILVSSKTVRRVTLKKFDELLHAFKLEYNSRLKIWQLN